MPVSLFYKAKSVRRWKGIQIPLWTVLFLIFSGVLVHAQNAPQQKLRGHIPSAVSQLTPLGTESSSERLKLAIGLPLRNEEELNHLLHELYDPASTNYHRYLTPEEFTARFGPTEADYEAVKRYAQQNGFTITGTHPNRVILDVEASVTNIEKSFHLTMRRYQHPREARTFHAPDTEPTLDLAVPILHISGLDNYSLPHPNSKPRPLMMNAKAVAQGGSGPGGTYRGTDFRNAYSVGPLTGAGQSVGLLQFDGYYSNDITNYINQAGLSNVTLVNVAIDGGVPTPGNGVGEVSLDIEMVLSMAPGISQIIVYEAPNPSPWVDLLSRMANDNLAKQLSCSWGGGSPDPSSEVIFRQMAAQGQSFFNASGDSDAFTGSIDFPSESTNITQVGGTTLTMSGGAYVSETVWNWGPQNDGTYVGSSGGISKTYAIPSYQQGIDMTANQGSTTKRNIPDVALTGDDVYVVYGNGQTGSFGGTSCAAPLWAGFMALVNQQAAQNGQPPAGFINPAIYNIGKANPNYTSIFHDVTTGNNFSSSSPSKYSAVAGYDLCTGWGSPNGTNLINVLAPPADLSVINPAGYALVSESCQPPNGAIDSGETVTVNFSLVNAGGLDTANLVATLIETNGVGQPSGAQNYGVVTGGGAAVSRSFSFTVLGTCGGTITPTFQLQDGAVNLGLVAFRLPIGKLAASFTENFDAVSAPSLPSGWTSTGGGGASAWVTSSSTRDTLPNAAFCGGSSSVGSNALVSPNITLPLGSAGQLSFRNNYNLEAKTLDQTTAYDGGVLEIKIGSGAFTDIVTAGGTFVTGGYNRTIATTASNPLGGRQAWSGNSHGFTNTVVNLPSSAAGQIIQLRWRFGADTSVTSVGWYIDSISISNLMCCSDVVNHPAVLNTIADVIMLEKTTLTFTNFASDTDQPTQTLAYSLSNAPAGANIGTSSGVFSWTPTEAQGPSTNNITVVVTDNGTPPLSTSQSFNIIVLESNEPPVLAPVSSRTIHAGMTLAITNTATDPDLPANALTFSLNAAPAGASINSTNGLFLWTPDSSFVNTTSTVTVVVTDNNPWSINSQHLTDTESFDVAVAPAPAFSGGTVSGGALTLNWSSIPGQKYRVQYSTNLTGGNWTDLSPDITASGATSSLTDPSLSGAQRFYRVLVLP